MLLLKGSMLSTSYLTKYQIFKDFAQKNNIRPTASIEFQNDGNIRTWFQSNSTATSLFITNHHESSLIVMTCHEQSLTIMNCHELSSTMIICHESSRVVINDHQMSWNVMNFQDLIITVMNCPELSWLFMICHEFWWINMNCHQLSVCLICLVLRKVFSVFYWICSFSLGISHFHTVPAGISATYAGIVTFYSYQAVWVQSLNLY